MQQMTRKQLYCHKKKDVKYGNPLLHSDTVVYAPLRPWYR